MGSKTYGAFLLCILMGFLPIVSAQETEQPAVIVVTEIKIKPPHVGQFEDALKKLGEAHRKLNTGATWQVSQSQSGEAFVFVIVAAYQNWGALDEVTKRGTPPEILIRAFGEEEGQRIARQALESFASLTTHYWRARPDLALR